MRLRAWDLTIERGGRRVIAELSFEAPAGAALIVTGSERGGKDQPAQGARRLPAD